MNMISSVFLPTGSGQDHVLYNATHCFWWDGQWSWCQLRLYPVQSLLHQQAEHRWWWVDQQSLILTSVCIRLFPLYSPTIFTMSVYKSLLFSWSLTVSHKLTRGVDIFCTVCIITIMSSKPVALWKMSECKLTGSCFCQQEWASRYLLRTALRWSWMTVAITTPSGSHTQRYTTSLSTISSVTRQQRTSHAQSSSCRRIATTTCSSKVNTLHTYTSNLVHIRMMYMYCTYIHDFIDHSYITII